MHNFVLYLDFAIFSSVGSLYDTESRAWQNIAWVAFQVLIAGIPAFLLLEK